MQFSNDEPYISLIDERFNTPVIPLFLNASLSIVWILLKFILVKFEHPLKAEPLIVVKFIKLESSLNEVIDVLFKNVSPGICVTKAALANIIPTPSPYALLAQ